MRIGIVNDTAMVTEALRRAVTESGLHKVVWSAASGAEAVANCRRDTPDLILMDIVMPAMDGVEATREIMRNTPCAILVVTEALDTRPDKVFECLGAGALDAIKLSPLGSGSAGGTALLTKIHALGRLMENVDANSNGGQASRPSSEPAVCGHLVLIGASAGGPDAVGQILEKLPADFPAGIVVVQHIDFKFVDSLASWLEQRSTLPVRLAREGDAPQSGVVLLADSHDHLRFASADRLAYTSAPADSYCRPSIDVLFESAARHWKKPAAGVLLTGMGRDGAYGLKQMLDAGFTTIAQNAASSIVYGMPKAAAALRAAGEVLPLTQIAPRLVALFPSHSDICTTVRR
jgi:two-component system response regulator WspF